MVVRFGSSPLIVMGRKGRVREQCAVFGGVCV